MFNYSTREEIGASISVERKRNTRATNLLCEIDFSSRGILDPG